MKFLKNINEWYNKNLEQKVARSLFAVGGLGWMSLKKRILKWVSQSGQGIILDIGSGDRKWENAVKGQGSYFALDYSPAAISCPWRETKPNVIADGLSLPVLSESVDVVLSISVLEHVTSPEKLVAESARVLKKNGRLIMVGPGDICMSHGAPHNYYNMTEFGYKLLLEQNGLEIEQEFFPLKFWSTVARLMYMHIVRNQLYNRYSIGKLFQIPVFLASLLLSPVINILCGFLDRISLFDRRGYHIFAFTAVRKINNR